MLFRSNEKNKELLTFESEQGKTITAEITLHGPSSKNPLKYNYVWGSDPAFGPPDSLIIDVRLSLSGKKIQVPLSAYCDLTNYEKSWIESESGLFILNIKGGQTSEVYHAKIYFDNFVRKRIVRSRIFPENAWDETIYHINELNI